MRRTTLAALLAACISSGTLAQTLAADPAAAVPAVPYRSAFGSPVPVPPSTEVNLADWAQANADVGRNLRGHTDILKWESANPAPSDAADPQAAGAVLTPAQAVALALRHQAGLIDAPQASALARAQLDAQVLTLSHNVHRAWINAVAARQTEAHQRQIADAAQTGAEMGQRMARIGNWSKAQWLQEQLAQSAAASQLALDQQSAFGATEALVRLLGLWGSGAQVTLPTQLPALPATLPDAADMEAMALRHQPELTLARMEAQQALAGVPKTDLRQWQQAVDTALQIASRPAESALGSGLGNPSATPVLPPGQVLMTHALERALHSQARAHTLAVATRSQAREAYFRYRTAVDRVKHLQATALLSAALQEETQLRYNGMLASTWDLLASARARVQSESAAHQAQRDAWLAYIDLQAVLSGALVNFSSTTSAAGSSPAANPGH